MTSNKSLHWPPGVKVMLNSSGWMKQKGASPPIAVAKQPHIQARKLSKQF
jgi:hypothetical protein